MQFQNGEIIEDNPIRGFRRIWYDIDDKHGVIKTEYYATDALLDKNASERSENYAWGNGAKIASVPLNIFYQHLLPALKAKDDRYIQRWFQDSDHSKWRTRDKI